MKLFSWVVPVSLGIQRLQPSLQAQDWFRVPDPVAANGRGGFSEAIV